MFGEHVGGPNNITYGKCFAGHMKWTRGPLFADHCFKKLKISLGGAWETALRFHAGETWIHLAPPPL